MNKIGLTTACLALGLTVSGHAASIHLTFRDPFTSLNSALTNTKIRVFSLTGQQLLETPYTDGSGNATLPTISLAEQNVVVVAIPNSPAVNLNPDRSCLSALINGVIGSNSNFYPTAKKLLVSQLKQGTSLNIDDGYSVLALRAADKARELATSYLTFTPPKITMAWKPCGVLDCGGADACFSSATGYVGDWAVSPSNMRVATTGGFETKKWLDFVIGHEYGHYLHYKLQNGYWPSTSGPSPHFFYTIASPGFAWKEGFADFWGNYVVQVMDGDPDYLGFEYYPQKNPGSRSIGNESHVAAFLWDIFNFDAQNWGGDEIYNEPHWGTIKEVLQANSNTINNVQDFYNKYVSMFGSAWELSQIFSSTFTTGWGRDVYTQNFDCPVGTDCGPLTGSTLGFWDVLNMGLSDAGTSGGVRNVQMIPTRTGSGFTGHANAPWLYQIGFTRNAPGGLLAKYEIKYGNGLNWARTTFSLLQGVNTTWSAVTCSINPNSTGSDAYKMGIDLKDYNGTVLKSARTAIDPTNFLGKTVVVSLSLAPAYNSSPTITLTLNDKATGVILGSTTISDVTMSLFTGIRFEHEMPDYPISFDQISIKQLN